MTRHNNRYLAELHAGYGYGGHESIDTEFWRRNPALGELALVITSLHGDDYTDQDDRVLPEIARVIADLRVRYRSAVDRIASHRYWPPD